MIDFIYKFNVFSCFMIGLFVLTVKSRPALKGSLYANAKIFLGVASILIALGNTTIVLDNPKSLSAEMFPGPVLIVSQLQAMLFTFLVLILFNSHYVKWQNIIKHLIPTIIFCVIYTVFLFFFSTPRVYSIFQLKEMGNPIIILRIIFGFVYLAQIAVYVRLFKREREIYICKIETCLSDTDKYTLRWATRLFYQATAIGLLVFIFMLSPSENFDIILTAVLPFFYLTFSVRYVNYNYRLFSLIPVIDKVEDYSTIIEDDCAIQIEAMISQCQLYFKQGVSLADYANELRVPERKLSAYINKKYGCRFKQWVNAQRVKYVKDLIENGSDLSIEIIAEHAGFANKGHLSKTFKEIEKCSFSEYKTNINR